MLTRLRNRIYYNLKPLIPRPMQILLRRYYAVLKKQIYRNVWPIDQSASKPPNKWSGWPSNRKFALVLTHDVDTSVGLKRCYKLMETEKKLGFRSSFNFVPERYGSSSEVRQFLAGKEYEVGVHGLNHDGKLFASRKVFQQRAIKVNDYLRNWGCTGFRSPAMHHKLEWMHELDIEYDSSTFDTDPFEPQPDGVGTIFPFWVEGTNGKNGYVELPCTLPQDFTLFVLLNQKDIKIWEQKLEWIAANGGMALLNTHPDYMNFNEGKLGIEEYPADFYYEFLNYAKKTYHGHYWHALPKDIALFYRREVKKNRLSNNISR